MANEVTNFNIGGVDHAVKDEGGRALIAALQQALDALTGGDTTTAIETFQEVIDFLSGVTDDETLIGKLSALNNAINAKYSKPASGIPASDLASTIQTAITLANSAYQKPSGGIPASDLAEAILTSLGKADTAYQKPSGGIPNNDLAGSISYTKLAGSIPKTKLATAVQTSLGKADTAVQPTALTDLFSSIVYDQTTHRFNFYGKGDTSHTTPLAYIDATQLSGIVDNLNTNDSFSALSAAQGVFIKSQINFVYDKLRALFDLLASVAFLDAKPAKSAFLPDLNWSNATTYDISYSLTNLNATSMPTSIDEGASSIIVLEPEANHVLPLAVRVTNATLESYNKNTGEIVISNPTDDVVIEADAICTDYRVLFPAVLADYSGTYYCIATYSNDAGNRACVVLPRLNLVSACTWGTSSPGVTSKTAEYHAAYSTIPIPFGATRVVITFTNSTYSMSSAIFNARGANQKATAWDSAQVSARVYELSQYPTATHVGFNFKKANNSAFSEAPTLSQLGLSIEFE